MREKESNTKSTDSATNGREDIFCGDLHASGDITIVSDKKFKDDIRVIPDAMNKIVELRGVTFTRADQCTDKRFTGVIAQEVQEVLPEAVNVHRDHLSVSYGTMVGLLIEGMKEQQETIEELSKEVADLRARMERRL